jgi:hypothetical protein
LRALINPTRSNINPRVGFELLSETQSYGQANSDKKRKNSKKRFFDRFSQFRNNNRLHQYICEYESTDDDEIDDHDEMIHTRRNDVSWVGF